MRLYMLRDPYSNQVEGGFTHVWMFIPDRVDGGHQHLEVGQLLVVREAGHHLGPAPELRGEGLRDRVG